MTQQPVDLGFDDDTPVAPPKRKPKPALLPPADFSTPLGRTLPHSIEAEEYLLSCCLIEDSDTLAKCLDEQLPPTAFYSPANRLIYEHLRDIFAKQRMVSVAILAEELKKSKQLEAVGGFAYLMQISGCIPTTAQAQYFLDKVSELNTLRELIKLSTGAVERCFEYQGDITELVSETLAKIKGIEPKTAKLEGIPLTQFKVPDPSDPSILIGNRWLSRGDGAIMASTSGMGKSSMCMQMACHWAIGRDIFNGFRPHGDLKSLIFQSEDSDADIGEVVASMVAAMGLSKAEVEKIAANVIVVSDRIHSGDSFITELKRQVAIHKPDIVWINPLLAYIGGDINDAGAVGHFLREQLNGVNHPPKLAYILIHHTSKPPKEKGDRRWNEVMYDMAGSADLTNWARAIISLRPADNEGEFNLVLAKRGPRAGLQIKVPSNKNPEIMLYQTVNQIGLRHSKQRIKIHGQDLPMIYWEMLEQLAHESQPKVNVGGRRRDVSFEDFKCIFPVGIDKALGFRPLLRMAKEIRPTMGNGSLMNLIENSMSVGELRSDKRDPKFPKYYQEPKKET